MAIIHTKICEYKDCTKLNYIKNLCSTHYSRLLRNTPKGERRFEQSHNMSYTITYSSWVSMRGRLRDVGNASYARYMEKGIKICTRWNKSFVDFYSDMGERPSKIYTLDRIDSKLHYSCGKCEECAQNGWLLNCRWATKSQQQWNKLKSKKNTSGYIGIVEINGRWEARLRYPRELGLKYIFYHKRCDTKEEAAIAYDQAAIFFRGEYAVTNLL